jgi:hypothetical protein
MDSGSYKEPMFPLSSRRQREKEYNNPKDKEFLGNIPCNTSPASRLHQNQLHP